jgi:hypothetical protein
MVEGEVARHDPEKCETVSVATNASGVCAGIMPEKA